MRQVKQEYELVKQKEEKCGSENVTGLRLHEVQDCWDLGGKLWSPHFSHNRKLNYIFLFTPNRLICIWHPASWFIPNWLPRQLIARMARWWYCFVISDAWQAHVLVLDEHRKDWNAANAKIRIRQVNGLDRQIDNENNSWHTAKNL